MVPMGEAILYTSPEPKTTVSINTKFKRMITLVKRRELSNLVAISYTQAAPHVGEITFEPDRAACGKDGLWFLWERPYFTPLQRRNYCINQYQILNE